MPKDIKRSKKKKKISADVLEKQMLEVKAPSKERVAFISTGSTNLNLAGSQKAEQGGFAR